MSACARSLDAGRSLETQLACPRCYAQPVFCEGELRCENCGASYPISNGVLDLRPPGTAEKEEVIAWSKHWAQDKQQTASQRFFSVYRKAVFARTVAYFLNRYFPASGVFVEAGSGTSETSMRVGKNAGARTLVALDLIQPVLERCHPVMDVRLCGDIFRLPLCDNSIDGLWNVGVMEHFTHPQIDAILREFRRVLKPGARIILLWPAAFSIPQRILRVCEWFINFGNGKEKFQFHPDEISQLRSVRQGREVLLRNGFRPVCIDFGVRSLMAFETLVGEKVPL